MPLGLSLFLIIVVSFVFGRLARRTHLSETIGMIVAGLFFTLPGISIVIFGHEELIINLGHYSILALMFLAGLEVSWSLLLKEERNAFVVTFFTIISSLVIGIITMLCLGFEIETAITVGVVFGITAEATKARVLMQLKKLASRVGVLLMGVGIINDIIGVLFLIGLSYAFTKVVQAKDLFMMFGVLAAFLLGIFTHILFDRYTVKIKIIEKSLSVLLVPFFFVSMGIYFNLNPIVWDLVVMACVIIASILGQMIGVFLTKPITKLQWRQLYLVGWGMNSKGLVELAIAYIALNNGLIPPNVYSALVISSLVTTLIFQFVIFRMVNKNSKIMD